MKQEGGIHSFYKIWVDIMDFCIRLDKEKWDNEQRENRTFQRLAISKGKFSESKTM